MFLTINELQTHYHVSGRGRNVILLHGWGGRIESFAPVHAFLEKSFQTYSLDLPGFGKSDPPPHPWGSEDYAAHILAFLHALNIENPILIGHSYGGRVSIRLAANEKINKLILVDSAGIKPRRTLKYYLKVYSYKLVKKLLLLPGLNRYTAGLVEKMKQRSGSRDYQNASGVIRDTLVKSVNEDLRHLLPRIQVPTLLIWGENDRATPPSDGQLMEKLIPDAGLVVLKGAGHFAYLDKLGDFLVIIDHFLQNDKELTHD